jgi:ketosteroid isomerase-like protein
LRRMDETRVRAMLGSTSVSAEDPAAAQGIYHDDAVLEFPQSGERFEGIENFREWGSD